mgnify:CR=1 FL=1
MNIQTTSSLCIECPRESGGGGIFFLMIYEVKCNFFISVNRLMSKNSNERIRSQQEPWYWANWIVCIDRVDGRRTDQVTGTIYHNIHRMPPAEVSSAETRHLSCPVNFFRLRTASVVGLMTPPKSATKDTTLGRSTFLVGVCFVVSMHGFAVLTLV